jgi:hypothetical protein
VDQPPTVEYGYNLDWDMTFCKLCGVLVVDQTKHTVWHYQTERHQHDDHHGEADQGDLLD